MNIKKVEELIHLMEKHNLSEITIEEEGVKVHLRKGDTGYIEKSIHAESPVLTPKGEVPKEAMKPPKNTVEIKAPMVGTFYRSPSPDAKAFVEVGGNIKDGDVLCIIEAMKLMNEIKSEVSGEIVDVLVKNGEPVEFGQVLFVVEPS